MLAAAFFASGDCVGSFAPCDNKCLKTFRITKAQSGTLGKHCPHPDGWKVKCVQGKEMIPKGAVQFCGDKEL